MFLTHFTRDCWLYVELNSSKESSYGAVVYHIWWDYTHEDLTKPLPCTIIKPILFLSRYLTTVEYNY